MRYIKIAIILLLFITIFSAPAMALTITKTPGERLTGVATQLITKTQDQLTQIQKRGDDMITQRITSLQRMLAHILEDKRLSAEEVASLSADINTTITNLTTLKSKIDADTTTDTAKTDVKSIVTSFHIYLVFEPKIHYLLAIDSLLTINQNLTSLSTKISTLITTLQSQGKDVTDLTKQVTDINTKLADANALLVSARSLLDGITATSGNPSTVFSTIKGDLVKVRQDYAGVRHDLAKIREDLAALGIVPSKSATTSASPTCRPRPACLDAKKLRCLIAEPAGGWCPPKASPTENE